MSKFPLLHSRRSLLGRTVRISTVISLALAAPLAALADGAYPDKPIKFVVPYPPGGGTDVVRVLCSSACKRRWASPS